MLKATSAQLIFCRFANATGRRFFSAPAQNLKRTALYPLHVELQGKIVEFGGWEMPLQYASDSIINSHIHTRQKASLFDVSHMAQLRLSGKDRIKFLEQLVVADLQELPLGSSKLSVFTNQKGGIIDDTMITNSGDFLFVVVNAGCAEKDIAHISNSLSSFKGDVKFERIDKSLLALQGPSAEKVVQALVKEDLSKMPFMTSKETKLTVHGGTIIPVRISRCGYTGEDGFEISVDHNHAIQLAKTLLKHGDVKPAGLGPRDTLRLEAGLCLYGHDIEQHTTPVEASLSWVIGKRRKEQGGFLGADKILSQIKNPSTVTTKRIGLSLTSGGPPPREGATIHDKDSEKEIGKITSGTFSPILKQAIAMAYIDTPYSKIGSQVNIKVRGKNYGAAVTKMPFVPTSYKKI